jgi:hypothetical protein
MADPVTTTPEDDTTPVFLQDDTAPILTPNPQVSDVRAQKAHLGLGDTMGMDKDSIRARIQSGQEQEFRDAAASNLTYQAARNQEQSLIDARNKKGAPLEYEEALKIVDPFNPANKPADPHDVIERAYAQKLIGMSNTAAAYMQDTVVDHAVQEVPEQLATAQANMSKLTTRLEFAKTMKQDVDNEIENQSWMGWGADFAKTMFQPYMEYKLRGNTPGVGGLGGGLLLGSNLKAQGDHVFNLPTDDQYKSTLTDIVNRLKKDNPQAASQFLDYVIGTSTNERNLQNVFTILSPLDYAQGFNLSKSLVRKIELTNRVNTAFKQIVQEAAKEGQDIPVKAVVQEAMGDVKSAGATRAADNISKAVTGNLDPVQDAKETLTTNFRLDADNLDAAPGPLSRDELTSLKDSFYKAGDNLYQRLVDVLRVNRTPVPLASEQAVKEYQAAARADYPGERILDIGSPIHMPETNTYHIPFTFGNAEGRLFSDPETALNYAKARGYADPRISEATGEVEKVPAKVTGSPQDFRDKARLEKSLPAANNYLDQLQTKYNRIQKGRYVGPIQPGELEDLTTSIQSVRDLRDNLQKQLDTVNGKLVTTEPVIEQHGLGYKFTVIRPYKETDDAVRTWLTRSDKALSTSSMEGWNGWKNSVLGWVRSADDTLSFNESLNRKIATYTQTTLKEWAKNEARDIEAVANQTKWYTPWNWYRKLTRKEMFDQFDETLRFAKTNTDDKGQLGAFFKNPQELDDHYQRFYRRSVTYPEVRAYFAHVKLNEGNRVLSEIAEFRNRARLGAEQHQLFTMSDGKKISSGFFDGISRNVFPSGGGQILIMGANKGEEKLYHLGANEIPGKLITKYRDLVETGKAKVIEIYDPDNNPLSGFVGAGKERIRYVLTSNVESKPLGLNHVNRRGGGHFDYDVDSFIKQAKISDEHAGDVRTDKRRVFKRVYTGDNTLMAGSGIKSQDSDIAAKMTRMNQLMRESKIDEAKELSKKLGIDWETMSSWYDPERIVNGKKVGARIDWNEPFYVVPRNKRIYDIDSKGLVDRIGGEKVFQDASKTGSLAKQFQVEYNQARDSEGLFTLKDVGSQGNPIYKRETAPLVDPIPTMNKALTRAIRSIFMDDYKIHAVEHWLREASPYLKAEESEIRAAPFYHFYNADKGAFTSGTDPATISNLLSNRLKIQQFVGMPNKVETAIHGLTQILADQFYQKFGPVENRNIVTKGFTVVPLWAISKWQDPISGIRSLAFNAKLGLFAVPQFLVQSQTFVNIWALGGRAAGAGTFAMMLHQWARLNASPEWLRAYDRYATKLNVFGSKWRPGEWMEARNELAKTGFEHVGGEYQLADDQMQHRFIKNEWNNFLDAGQAPFREGEKATRLGAYYTAFREFRDANPTKVLTDADRATILQKADLYTANMSRASASSLNSSIFSLPMQFLTYQVRMAELFFGKRLGETTGERALNRARLMGFYAAMYGAPGALGVTGYPFADGIREEAINHGYVPGNNQFTDAVMNGLVAWQLAMITGKGDYQKGSQYDVQGRWGTQGFTQLQESMRSDETVWKLIGGAGVDTFMSTIAHADPFWQFARQIVSDDEEGNKFKVSPADFLNIFSEISSADLVGRGIYALHTGRWIAKNGQYMEDVTPADVLFREITGFKTQDQSDVFLLHDIQRQEKEVQQDAARKITKDYQRGLDAVRDKDYDTAQTYFTNARARMIASGIPLDMRAKIMAEASKGYEPETLTSQWDWATRHVPFGQEATRLDAIQQRLKIQDYRNQP